MSSLGAVVSEIEKLTTVLQADAGISVDGNVVIDGSGLIAQSQIKELQSTITSLQVAIGNASGSADLNMQSHLIKNLGNAVVSGDAANKAYVDSTASNYIKRDGTSTVVADIPMSNKKITNLAACTSSADAANKAYVDGAISDIDFSAYVRKDGSGFTTNPSLGGYHWINCSDPIDPYDACTKHYCDNTYISISPTTTTVYNLSLAAGPDRPYYMSVSPQFAVSQNLAQTNAYGMYISAGSASIPVNSSITNGYGLFVERPTYGTNKYAAYFNGNTYVNGNVIATTTPTLATHLCNKDYVDGNFLKKDGSVTLTGELNAGNHLISYLAYPSRSDQAATVGFVNDCFSGILWSNFMKCDGAGVVTADIPLNNHKLTGVATPTLSTDAATKGYVDAHTPTVDLSAYLRIDGTQLYTNPSFNYYRLNNVGDPYDDQDAATKHYCDLNYIRVSPTTDSIYRFGLSPGLDRERYVDILPQFSVTGNLVQSYAYGMRINGATANLPPGSSIGTGISLYVDAPNVGTNQYTAYLNGNSVNTGRLQIGTIPTVDSTVMLDMRNSGNTSGYQNVSRLSVTNNADGTNFSRMYLGQYSTNVMFIEAADQSNTKGTLLLQPYGGSVKLGTALDANSNRIQNVYTPIDGGDAVNKTYTDAAITSINNQLLYAPVLVAHYRISQANNNSGATQNFTMQYPFFSNDGKGQIFPTSGPCSHLQLQTAGLNSYLGIEFPITSNGLYKVRYSLQYANDRAIVTVKSKPGVMNNSVADNTESTLGVYDMYIPNTTNSLGVSEGYFEDCFVVTRYPTETKCNIKWIATGQSGTGFQILLGLSITIYKLR